MIDLAGKMHPFAAAQDLRLRSILLPLLLLSGVTVHQCQAYPAPNQEYQRLLKIPAQHSRALIDYIHGDDGHYHSFKENNPYTPDYSDPYDHKVDAIGDDLAPEPYRNGDGTSMLGPHNRDRERQNPDMIRPPSTDHGSLPNMRWSFADSHVRIEVCTDCIRFSNDH